MTGRWRDSLPDPDGSETRERWRRDVSAALRVLADDLRKVHQREFKTGCGCGRDWPCPTVRILDTYTGGGDQ